MLNNSKIVATVATADIPAAKEFYGGTLGLRTMMDMPDIAGYLLPDGSALTVYARPNHRPPENTAVTFLVADVDAKVREMRAAGVTFEEYDQPGLTTVDGVATGEDGFKGAWFKDPAGNILALGSLPPM